MELVGRIAAVAAVSEKRGEEGGVTRKNTLACRHDRLLGPKHGSLFVI